MTTAFDIVTVACLAATVLAYFYFVIHNLQTLLHLVIAGVAFAAANQLGNAGFVGFAVLLIVAGLAYAAIVLRHNARH